MGLQMALHKESNFLFHDFPTAYWCIENLRYVHNNGINYTVFDFNAYPSRDAKYRQGLQIINQYEFGTAEGLAYNPRLYHWEAVFETAAIFPDGIPLSEASQKDTLYVLVKSYLGLADAIDVLEDR